MTKYFIYQFAAFGDCLFATIVAKQLKASDSTCEITWGISKRYASVLTNNPHVDKIVKFEFDPKTASLEDFKNHEKEVENIKNSGEYEIIHLQLLNKHIDKLHTTLRYSVLKIFEKPITVSKNAVLNLESFEISNVRKFITSNSIDLYPIKIIFECSPASGQSLVNATFAYQIADAFTKKSKNICFILSGPNNIEINNNQIFCANILTYRENLELINYCDLLVGCSSGISWLTICENCKPIPTIQLLNPLSDLFASMHFDFEINNLNTDHILEMINYDISKVEECISAVLEKGILNSKLNYHQVYKPSIFNLRNNIMKLVWLDYPIASIFRYIDSFILENIEFNNTIKITKIKKLFIVMISISYKLIYIFKQKIKYNA